MKAIGISGYHMINILNKLNIIINRLRFEHIVDAKFTIHKLYI